MPKQQVTEEQKALAQRIEQALTHAKESQNKSKALIAEECGVSAQAVNNWLRRGKISKRSLMLLAKSTNVDFIWLYTGLEATSNKTPLARDQLKEPSAEYTLDKQLLAQSIKKVLSRSDQIQLPETDYAQLANYITAEYFKALKDDDVISTLLDLSSN